MIELILVLVENWDGVLVIILNWFDCFNVFNEDMYLSLCEIFIDVVQFGDIWMILVIGVGCVFCVGQDFLDWQMVVGDVLFDFGYILNIFYNLLIW